MPPRTIFFAPLVATASVRISSSTFSGSASLDSSASTTSIFTTKHQSYLAENLHALAVELTPAEIAELDALRPAGDRAANAGEMNRTTAAK